MTIGILYLSFLMRLLCNVKNKNAVFAVFPSPLAGEDARRAGEGLPLNFSLFTFYILLITCRSGGFFMPKKEQNFEKSLLRLEEIVSEMENADPDLDKALELFAEGSELVKFCSGRLNEAKKKIEILAKDSHGIRKEEFKDE